jgi:serine/threonine protein kinase
LLDSNFLVKLSDLGITKILKRNQNKTDTFIGTLQYMSPERILNLKYDHKSDIWSFAFVFYELALG